MAVVAGGMDPKGIVSAMADIGKTITLEKAKEMYNRILKKHC